MQKRKRTHSQLQKRRQLIQRLLIACGISSAAAHFADGPSSAASSAAAAASALTAGLASCGHELPWCAASLTDAWSVLCGSVPNLQISKVI